jgi:outer membrane receptor protein involved in Fe transport
MKTNQLSTRRSAGAVCVLLVLASLSLLAPEFAWSQANLATFYGTVTDPSGASIPGATVTLTNRDTQAVTTKSTGVNGGFAFTFIPVGTYNLSISTDGFRTLARTGMSLTAGQQLQETFEMTLGTLSEVIEVEGELTQLNTVSAQQLQSYDITAARELPLVSRNITGLLKVAAGVVPSQGNSGTGVNLNGMGRNGTVYSVDGTNASGNTGANNPGTYQGGNLIDLLSVESVEAVNVIKGVIPAEYSNALGGQVNMVTKSGTNQWHGSLFGNFQRDKLNARHQFVAEKPPLSYNQFGGSLGGPIVKNKVFIFGTYEGYRTNANVFVQGNVPTNDIRAQLVAAVPDYALMLDSVPEPNQPLEPGATVGLFADTKEEVRRDNHYDFKGDWVISNNSRFAVTYTHGEPSRTVPRHYIDNDRSWTNSMDRTNFSFITGGATWTSESRVGINKTIQDRLDQFFDHIGPAGESGLLFGQRVPTFSTPLGWSGPGAEINHSGGPMTQVEQKYARYVGNHSLKIGGNYMRLEGTRANPEAPRYQFGTFDDMLNNSPVKVVAKFGTGDWNGLQTTFGFFVQDDWRIASNLTLNFGLRYDYYSNFVATGQGATPDAGLYNTDGLSLDGLFTTGPLLPRDEPYSSDANNFAPRLGFAYSPGGSNKTSIRGGFGMMYSTMIPEVFWNQPSQGVNLPNRFDFAQADIARFGIKYPQYNDDFFGDVLQATVDTPDAIFVSTLYDTNLQNPYTMQFSLDVQHQITPNVLFQTGFVGMRGLFFPMFRQANQPDRLTGLRPNSNLSQPDYVDSSQTTTYYGWQNSLRRRFSNRVSFDANYTWSKALSNGGGDIGAAYGGENSGSTNQDFFNLGADYGPTVADLTHYFAAGWVYEAPGASSNNAVIRNVLGQWTVSGIFRGSTGQRARLRQSSITAGQRADYVGGEAVLSNYTDTLQYLNPDAFARIPISSVTGAPIRPGNAGNGIVRAPGLWNLDLAIAKNFQIGETVALQVRTDLFNALNHTNLSGLRTSVNDNRFGKLTNTRGARVVQLNARLTF